MTVSSSIENFDAAAPITDTADVAVETVAIAAESTAPAAAIESTEPAVAANAAAQDNEAGETTAQAPENAFADLGVAAPLVRNLTALGITAPTPVQRQALPILLGGADLIASAPTGTGKTASFLLPAMTLMQQPAKSRAIGPRLLVLTPTRELAQQVSKAAISFAKGINRMKTVCITGGESYFNQNRVLSSPYEILVATPGRLMDQMNSGRIDFSRLEMLVLDEADRMLDMGFSDDVMAIADALPKERQTVCFTATLSPNVQSLTGHLMKSPQLISVKAEVSRQDAIDQHVVFVDDMGHKRRLLDHWLGQEETGQAIIFTATKRDAELLAEELGAAGHATVALHGDLQQRQRTRMLNQLRQGAARVLVATDVAARGIDVPAITHVFNFDLPKFAEDYVHRIGRTGRAGATGMAISFVGKQDLFTLRRIERFIGNKVKISEVEGLEARFKPGNERREGGAGPRGGKPYGGKGGYGGKPGFRKEGGGYGDRKPYGDRSDRGERSFADRGDRPARPFADRPYGDRPQGDRPQGDRPYGKRPQGDRPFGGDRPYGERKFNDRGGNSWGNGNSYARTERPRDFDEREIQRREFLAREGKGAQGASEHYTGFTHHSFGEGNRGGKPAYGNDKPRSGGKPGGFGPKQGGFKRPGERAPHHAHDGRGNGGNRASRFGRDD
ncbi:DEAD/DEAH box helicase [Oryzomicrobium terrae]|nr:DEAD/DEAH box helicase [Oryzomicrobium terrae]